MPAKSVAPAPGMQRLDRNAMRNLLRRRLEEGALQFVPEVGWIYAGAAEAEVASDNDIRREGMGSWLGGLATYTHFCTWTFSRPISVEGAMGWGKRHLRFLARWDVDAERGGTIREFMGQNRYRDKYEQERDERARKKAAKKRLQAFLATERGETGGLLHLHSLVARITHLKAFCGVYLPEGEWGLKCCMAHSWPCGYARVRPYDPSRGAKYYVLKPIFKDHLGEYELVGNFHCLGKNCSLSLH